MVSAVSDWTYAHDELKYGHVPICLHVYNCTYI